MCDEEPFWIRLQAVEGVNSFTVLPLACPAVAPTNPRAPTGGDMECASPSPNLSVSFTKDNVLQNVGTPVVFQYPNPPFPPWVSVAVNGGGPPWK